MRYVRRGSGQPVVLLHGAFGGLEDFEATLLEPLAGRHDVLAFDRPGSGYSERPGDEVADPAVQARLLRGATCALGVERPVLVGFSWGAAVALAWALEWPDEVAAVVSVSGAVEPWDGATDLAFRVPAWPLVGDLLVESVIPPLGHLLARSSVREAFAPEPVHPDFARSPLPLALRPESYRAQSEDMRLLNRFLAGQATRYAELAVPVVALAGEGDRVASPQVHSRALVESVPRGELELLPGGGHQILYTRRDAVLRAVARAFELAAEGQADGAGVPSAR